MKGYLDLLRQRGVLSAEDANKVYLHAVHWAISWISRGMFDANGRPKAYAQVAGIQIGYLVDSGALEWQADQPAANGKDRGRFQIHFDKLAPAAAELMQRVGQLYAKGDRPGAEALIGKYVAGDGLTLIHQAEVAERVAALKDKGVV